MARLTDLAEKIGTHRVPLPFARIDEVRALRSGRVVLSRPSPVLRPNIDQTYTVNLSSSRPPAPGSCASRTPQPPTSATSTPGPSTSSHDPRPATPGSAHPDRCAEPAAPATLRRDGGNTLRPNGTRTLPLPGRPWLRWPTGVTIGQLPSGAPRLYGTRATLQCGGHSSPPDLTRRSRRTWQASTRTCRRLAGSPWNGGRASAPALA